MKRHIYTASTASFALILILYISLSNSLKMEISGKFSTKKSIITFHEHQKQDFSVVSIDKKYSLYGLEGSSSSIINYTRSNSLNVIELSKNKSQVSFNKSASVSGAGDYIWCTSKLRPVSSPSWQRSVNCYDKKGKLIQQWFVDYMTPDFGSIQAIGSKSLFVNNGGGYAIYTIGQNKPQISDDSIGVNDYVDWDGRIWNIYSRNKTGAMPLPLNEGELPKAMTPYPSFDSHPLIEPPASPRDFVPFWHSPTSGLYLRTLLKEYEGQTQFGFGLYRMDDRKLVHIVDLKRRNDPLLRHLGTNICLGAPLWGEGDSVTIYAYEDLSPKPTRPAKHFIIRISREPRWKTWFSIN